jgi:hypothetical protein
VIILKISPFARFLNYFSLRFEGEQNVDLKLFLRMSSTSPLPFKMLHLSHSIKIVSQRLKTRFETRMFVYSFVESTSNIALNVSSNLCTIFLNVKK